MTTLWADIVYGCRMLLKRPGFTAAALLSLAIGIGANTTIFSLINVSLLRGLPYPEADQLQILWTSFADNPNSRSSVTAKNYYAWQEQSKSFSAIGGRYSLPLNLGAEENGAPAEQINTQRLTASMWDVLDVQPLLGRVFTAEEARDLNPDPVVVLSYPFWQSRLGGKPDVVGQTLMIEGVENTIIGVMPEGFDFASYDTDIFAPQGFRQQQLDSAASFLLVAGRLKDGVTPEQAQAEMDAIAAGLAREFPDRNAKSTVRVQGLHDALFEEIRRPLLVLQTAVGFVLLIACANIAGLLLARASSRKTEMAVRSSLGAARGRIVRQLLTESILLSIAGGVVGIALAWAGLRVLIAAIPPGIPYLADATINGPVLLLIAALSMLTGLVFGLVPALQTSKVDLSSVLNESGRTGMDADSRQRFRSALVATQIALSLVLLIGAGLMLNSFLKLQANELGVDPENLLTFEVRVPQNELMEPIGTFRGVGLWQIFPTTGLLFDRTYQRMQTIPGVVSVAAASRPPLSGGMGTAIHVIGGSDQDGKPPVGAVYFAVTPNYFDTLRVPLLQGRDFDDHDTASAEKVVIVNEEFSDQFFPSSGALGQTITLDFVPDEPARQIVGVVGNYRMSAFQNQMTPMVFVPHLQQTETWQGPMWNYRAMMAYVLRTSNEPMSVVPSVRAALADVDPSKPAANIRTVEQYLGDQSQGLRLYMLLLSVFGVCAAILAAIGIYGVMAYAIASRTREIGIRMALGATGGRVTRLVLRQALVLIVLGVVLGVGGALAATRFLESELYEVSPTDPATFVAVSAGLVVVALLACVIPTRRALRVDPGEALRYE